MDDAVIKAAAADSPTRCQSVIGMKQCGYESVPGYNHCLAHGGKSFLAKKDESNLQNYMLGKYQFRVAQKANSSGLKSLRDEIGILRMLLENQFSQVKDDTDLMVASQAISDMVAKIERLVMSCHKLDLQLGDLLDKTALMAVAGKVVQSITEHLSDISDADVRIGRISQDIIASIEGLQNVDANG